MPEPRGSFGRCVSNPKFIDRFYEIFLVSHPAIAPMFKNTDFVQQKDLLRTGLSMMLMYEEGKDIAKMSLNRLGKSHGKAGMNIDRNLYPYWIDSLVDAVKECDRQFTPEIEQRWRVAMRRGIDYMISKGS